MSCGWFPVSQSSHEQGNSVIVWTSHLSWQLWLCRAGTDRKCVSVYANVWGDDHQVHRSNTTAKSRRAVCDEKKLASVWAELVWFTHKSHSVCIWKKNDTWHVPIPTITPNRFLALNVSKNIIRVLHAGRLTDETEVRHGGETRLSLAVSSSLAAHRDLFFLSPPCVAAVWQVAMCSTHFMIKTAPALKVLRLAFRSTMFTMFYLELISVICVTRRWKPKRCCRSTIIFFMYVVSLTVVLFSNMLTSELSECSERIWMFPRFENYSPMYFEKKKKKKDR